VANLMIDGVGHVVSTHVLYSYISAPMSSFPGLKSVQEGRGGGFIAVLHTASVACSLYLLMAFISHDWLDIAHVLLAHPKVFSYFFVNYTVVSWHLGIVC
jgi:hypothetical protein